MPLSTQYVWLWTTKILNVFCILGLNRFSLYEFRGIYNFILMQSIINIFHPMFFIRKHSVDSKIMEVIYSARLYTAWQTKNIN